MKVVVLAGGKGTRMGELTRFMPKPMLPVAGKPILEHQIEVARRYGFTQFILLTGHQGDVIEQHFGNGAKWGVQIQYYPEPKPLGTAGAVRGIADQLDEDFLVFYGDTIFDLDLEALIAAHRKADPLATLVVHPNDHPYDSDLVELDETGRVTAMHAKPHSPDSLHRNLVSAALYVASPRLLQHVTPDISSDFGRDIFPALVAAGQTLHGYVTSEYIKDVGTSRRITQVERDVLSGRVARFNRRHKRPAIFLDRDGVLNADKPEHIRSPEELQLLPGVADAIREINASDYLAVVVTNQPMIAKGFATCDDLERIHAKLESELGAAGAFIDRIYHCPHHPEKGFPGERADLKIKCDCRKPATGMIDRAVRELGIDLSQSFIIGDRTVDIQTGLNAGITPILVRTGFAGKDMQHPCEAKQTFDTLNEAIRYILHQVDASPQTATRRTNSPDDQH